MDDGTIVSELLDFLKRNGYNTEDIIGTCLVIDDELHYDGQGPDWLTYEFYNRIGSWRWSLMDSYIYLKDGTCICRDVDDQPPFEFWTIKSW